MQTTSPSQRAPGVRDIEWRVYSDDDDCPFPGGFSVDEEVDEEEMKGQGEDEEPVKSKVETSRDLTGERLCMFPTDVK